jgi:RNase P subunit RPR2
MTIAICPNCRAEIQAGELTAAVRAGTSLKCKKCGATLRTESVKHDLDKLTDDFKKSFPKKIDINLKF